MARSECLNLLFQHSLHKGVGAAQVVRGIEEARHGRVTNLLHDLRVLFDGGT